MKGGGETGAGRSVVYCVVPRDLAPKLHEPLRRHYADRPDLEVVVERRDADRRVMGERRSGGVEPDDPRRRIRNAGGRRIGERRAALMPVEVGGPLPRRARAHAARLSFVERVEPSGEYAEDLDTARLVTRIQAGGSGEFGTLYMRYFDRVYGYLRLMLNDVHDAEDATQRVFLNVLEALPCYERRRQPFRAWLFKVARNQGLNYLRDRNRTEVFDPQGERPEPAPVDDGPALRSFSWISDQDLLVLIERLPLAQRQVLVLRYLADLPAPEIAVLLDRSPDDVRMLQHRAHRFLRKRLIALGRGPERSRVQRRVPEATVLRARRFALRRSRAGLLTS